MSRLTRRDEFGAYAPLQSPRRGQLTMRELVGERARLEASPIEVEPDLPELTTGSSRDAIVVLLLGAAFAAGMVLHRMFH